MREYFKFIRSKAGNRLLKRAMVICILANGVGALILGVVALICFFACGSMPYLQLFSVPFYWFFTKSTPGLLLSALYVILYLVFVLSYVKVRLKTPYGIERNVFVLYLFLCFPFASGMTVAIDFLLFLAALGGAGGA